MKTRYTFVVSFKPDGHRYDGHRYYDGYFDGLIGPPEGELRHLVSTLLLTSTRMAESYANRR